MIISTNIEKKSLLDNLYRLNYQNANRNTGYNIPRIIHQIWLGCSLPAEYRKFTDSWKKFHPSWNYILWNERNISSLKTPEWRLYDSIQNVAQKSDYLRYHILNQYGGIYVDTDFECLKSFDDLMFLDFFTSAGYPPEVELYIGLIASIPNYPLLTGLISGMKVIKGGRWKNIFQETGSYYFTRKFFEIVNTETKGVVAFPVEYFYPFPDSERKKGNPYNYIKDCSYAVHHWAVSWSKKRRA